MTSTSNAVNPPSVRVTWNMATTAATSMSGTSPLVARSIANEARYDA